MAPSRSRPPPRTRSKSRSRRQTRSESRGSQLPTKKAQSRLRVRKNLKPKPPVKSWFERFTENRSKPARSRRTSGSSATEIKKSVRGKPNPAGQQQKRRRTTFKEPSDDDDEVEYDDNGGEETDEDEIDHDDDNGRDDDDPEETETYDEDSESDKNPVAVDLKKFRKLWETKHRSFDFTITCEKTHFRVHRRVLCARSSVLASIFKSQFKHRSSGSIMDFYATPPVVGALIEWIYKDKVDSRLAVEHLCGLVEIADRFELQDLVDTLLSMICTQNKLNADYFYKVLTVTDTRDLTKACEKNLETFCKKNLSRLLEGRKFMELITVHRIYDTLTEDQRAAVRKRERSNKTKDYRSREMKRKAEAAAGTTSHKDKDDDEDEEEEMSRKRQRVVRIASNN